MKVLPLSVLVSVLGIFTGLTGVNAQAILSAIGDQSNSVEDLPQPTAIEEGLMVTQPNETVDKASKVQKTLEATEQHQQMEPMPFANDPRHRFSEPCPACGMG